MLQADFHNEFWALSPDNVQAFVRACQAHRACPPAGSQTAVVPTAPAAAAPLCAFEVQDGVAIIPVRGTLTRSALLSFWNTPLSQGQDTVRAQLDAALADDSVKAILLDIDSPGGQVAGCKELADHIASIAQRKPCAAYANGLCASAAFWLAAATGRIFAPQTAQVGSIGVISVHADFSRANEAMGISYTYLTGGAFKAVGNADHPLSDADRLYLHGRISSLHALFRADVARHLQLTAPADQWAEGQIFLAAQAQALGLVQAIVPDLSAAISQLSSEVHMNKEQLAQQFPELLAQIESEAEARAQSAFAGQKAQYEAAAREATLSVLSSTLGEDACARVQTTLDALSTAGISAAQFSQLNQLFAQTAPSASPVPAPSSDTLRVPSAASILAALEQAHGVPLATAPEAVLSTPLLADALRRKESR